MNRPPKPDFSFSVAQSDPTGYTVNFDGNTSPDPEDDPLTFEWNFGDGKDSTGDQTTHRYSPPGEYSVLLTVTDSEGQRQQVYETVKIGVPPRVDILSPIVGQDFQVGEVLKLRGKAFDQFGNIVPDESLVWEERQHHADHFHPFLEPTTGNNLYLFPAPNPEDYWASTNSFLRVILTVSDSFWGVDHHLACLKSCFCTRNDMLTLSLSQPVRSLLKLHSLHSTLDEEVAFVAPLAINKTCLPPSLMYTQPPGGEEEQQRDMIRPHRHHRLECRP